MPIRFKMPILIGLMGVMAFLLSGCFIRLMFGFVFVDDLGTFIDLTFDDVNVARCREVESFDGATRIDCLYNIAGEGVSEITSTASLVRDFGLFGVVIDPVIVQVPDDASNVIATYDDGTGPQDLLVSVVDSFMADANTVVTPEAGHRFIIFDFPPSVHSSITGTDPTTGPQFDFDVQIEIDSLRTVELKSLFAGKTEVAGETFYFPLFPCTTDFATIPAVTVHASPFPQVLSFQVESLLGQNPGSGCDDEVYDFTGVGGGDPEADLEMSKSDDADPVTVGDDIEYTLTVMNNGPDAAENVVVTDTLPAGTTFVSATPEQGACNENSSVVTCDLGDLASGGDLEITIVATANNEGTFTNNAEASSDTNDPDPDNNSASEDTDVTAPPSGESNVDGQLQLIDISNPPPGNTPPGGIYPITVTIRNNGASLDNVTARVTVLEYLSGANPPPELANRTTGTPPNVGAEIEVGFPGDTFDNGETTQVVFEVMVPVIEQFRAAVNFLTIN